ncbi:MAG: ATP-binding cassette domain-containing protein [Spirochaetes bacterium]|jgi:ABC-2 type transport system ATP-binding protein|nr:ATP-binding cassette domain-containing protein [Spirochaetota bacterium]
MDALALAVHDVVVFDRRAHVILQVPEFTLTHGEVCGIYGASGDGANLFLDCVSGLCRPAGGRIRIYGRELDPSASNKYSVGVLPREGGLFPDFTAGENMKLALRFSRASGRSRRERIGQISRVASLLALHPWMQTTAKRLPGGVAQRLALACALAHEPHLLIADDPWRNADIESRELIEHALRQHCDRGNTLLFASPRETEVSALASEICLFSRTALIARGTLDDLRRYVDTHETIIVRVQDQASSLVERFSSLSGVLRCEATDSTVTIHASPGSIRLTRLVEHVQMLGLELLDMYVRKPGLDDVYAAVIGEAGRR